MTDQYSATNSLLGYLYELRFALLRLMQAKEEGAISIELLDDVTWSESNDRIEYYQLKHHTVERTATLTDSSSDIWKTVRIWSERYKSHPEDWKNCKFCLVTTGRASDNSNIRFFRPGVNIQEKDEACEKLINIAKTSTNMELQPAFSEFLSLTSEFQHSLISNMELLDSSPNIQDSSSEIMRLLIGVRTQHQEAIFESLEGWWNNLIIKSFISKLPNLFSRSIVLDKIATINDEYKPDFLPIDFINNIPKNINDFQNGNYIFVKQLKIIMLHEKRIEKAIYDYYKAYHQIARWTRYGLLEADELENYQNRLIDEWERYCLRIKNRPNYDDSTDDLCVEIGKNTYDWMESAADFRIRKSVSEPFVMRGSYQILANENPPRIFWHPKFIDQLLSIISFPS